MYLVIINFSDGDGVWSNFPSEYAAIEFAKKKLDQSSIASGFTIARVINTVKKRR